jgi:hypothetical protein
MNAIRGLLVVLLALVFALPIRTAEPERIQAAIKLGAAHLQQVYSAGQLQGGEHGVGAAGLAGLAMLEGGIPTTDPAIQNIAKMIRTTWPTDTKTYHVSLAILFLDRLGDPADVPAIQFLGTRLYGGLTTSGCYSYNCNDVVPLTAEIIAGNSQMVGTPGGIPKGEPKKPDNGFPKVDKNTPNTPAGKLHASVAPYNTAVRRVIQSAGRQGAGGDNSNTQFGLIGLWVASRHGVPCEDAFVILEAHFLTSQNPADAGWGYMTGPVVSNSTTAMTCAGLLGLAIGTSRSRTGSEAAPATKEPGAGSNDPFDRTKKPPAEAGAPKPGANNPLLPTVTPQQRKFAMDSALKSIGLMLRSVKTGQIGLQQFVGLGDEYYTLWSIERVGMALGLNTIGDMDWYQLGADHLLAKQSPDGAWPSGSHGGVEVSTSFAVLFLSKSNFVKDLTRRLTGQVKDPGKAELKAGKDFKPPLIAPPEKMPEPGTRPGESTGPAPTTADVVTNDLVNGKDFDTKLREARDTKGEAYTTGLVKAIPRLGEDRQKQARDALAERLTRMTAKTLRTMMREPDSELRRAAILACGMKDDKTHVPDLIDRITDPADSVVRVARASLKSLTNKDFGPEPNATDEAKRKAAAEWNKWYLTEGK